MDGIEYRTNPRRRISDAHRSLVAVFARQRMLKNNDYPDGRPMIFQPFRLVLAWRALDLYWQENSCDDG